MYENQDEKHEKNLEECAKQLSKKVANIKPAQQHTMNIEKDFQNFDFQKVLDDLENFLNSNLSSLENYEKWLEDGGEPN